MAGVTVVNFVFRLHYKVYSLLLLGCAAVTAGYAFYYKDRICSPYMQPALVLCGESYNGDIRNLSGLFIVQSIVFCLTFLFWRHCENGTMNSFLMKDNLKEVAKDLMTRKFVMMKWTENLVLWEVMNVMVVIAQAMVINYQLNGRFMDVGVSALHLNGTEMSTLFPKTQVCALLMPGRPAMQTVCDMPLHYCYEMVFVVLWFSLSFLAVLSCAVLFWRALTLGLNLCSSRWIRNQLEISCQNRLSPSMVEKLKSHFGCFDWVFLKYLAKNMGPARFYDLILELTSEEEPDTPLYNEKLALKL